MKEEQSQERTTDEHEAPSRSSVETAPRPKVVVGLGNPGEKYTHTRHNVGFRVVEELARRQGVSTVVEECRSRIFKHRSGDAEIWWVAPQTYMNRSGFAVRCLRERYDLAVEDFLIVYDEVHLSLGMLRLRTKGSPGGHRGMESIAESLGTDRIARLRLGVADEQDLDGAELVSFVLGEFASDEQAEVEAMIRRAADACELWCEDGPEPTMQKFNGPPSRD